MVKILIVEDLEQKADYLAEEVRLVYEGDEFITFVNNCNGASQSLDKAYDVVLCDVHIGSPSSDGKIRSGRDFAKLYGNRWPKAFVRVYSGEEEAVSKSVDGIKCYSTKELVEEIRKSKKLFYIDKGPNEDEECAGLSHHTLLNKEWWNAGRKLKFFLVGAGSIAIAIMALVNADEMYQVKIAIPYHMKCFRLINDSINGPLFSKQDCVNRTVSFALLKIQARQETMMSRGMAERADSAYQADSIKFESMYRMSH